MPRDCKMKVQILKASYIQRDASKVSHVMANQLDPESNSRWKAIIVLTNNLPLLYQHDVELPNLTQFPKCYPPYLLMFKSIYIGVGKMTILVRYIIFARITEYQSSRIASAGNKEFIWFQLLKVVYILFDRDILDGLCVYNNDWIRRLFSVPLLIIVSVCV